MRLTPFAAPRLCPRNPHGLHLAARLPAGRHTAAAALAQPGQVRGGAPQGDRGDEEVAEDVFGGEARLPEAAGAHAQEGHVAQR